MDDRHRTDEALFKHALLGSLPYEQLRRGELKGRLRELARQTVHDAQGRAHSFSWRTLEEWYYELRSGGFEQLKRQPRRDRGSCKALPPHIVDLVLALKGEDPGCSAPVLLNTLRDSGRLARDAASVSTIQRLLKIRGLSGPKMEVVRRERFRFAAYAPNELWQGDALHGPKLFNPAAGREETVKVFALIDDHSRLVVNLMAGFRETEAAFLALLHGAIARRGLPRKLYLDNGASFVGRDLRIVCAQLGIQLLHSAPYESSARGKIERLWRTLRGQLLDRLDSERVTTLDALNTRLWAWLEGLYNVSGHEGLAAQTPREVWEAGAEAVRFVSEPSRLEELFRIETVRHARNDATVTLDGITYEVPGHLRRQKVTLRYSPVTPERIWAVDGGTEIALKPVDPEANASRRRRTLPCIKDNPQRQRTGLNSVEALLARVTGRKPQTGTGGEK